MPSAVAPLRGSLGHACSLLTTGDDQSLPDSAPFPHRPVKILDGLPLLTSHSAVNLHDLLALLFLTGPQGINYSTVSPVEVQSFDCGFQSFGCCQSLNFALTLRGLSLAALSLVLSIKLLTGLLLHLL